LGRQIAARAPLLAAALAPDGEGDIARRAGHRPQISAATHTLVPAGGSP